MKFLRFLFILVVLLACVGSMTAKAYAQDETDNTDTNIARLQVKISELEDQIRKLQGTIEQTQYENKQLKAQLDKTNTDMEYRFGELEKKQQAAAAAPVAVPAEPAAPDSGTLQPVQSPASTTPMPSFASPRDHYNYAFRLLNQAKYKESGDAFAAFTKTYPKDPLIGNAWYWLGETYYVNHDYVRAADDFRQGYESMPTGPKAPDNLLKLAMSLNALKKDDEACTVLKQVAAKFGSMNSMKQRAEQEMNTIGCNQ